MNKSFVFDETVFLKMIKFDDLKKWIENLVKNEFRVRVIVKDGRRINCVITQFGDEKIKVNYLNDLNSTSELVDSFPLESIDSISIIENELSHLL